LEALIAQYRSTNGGPPPTSKFLSVVAECATRHELLASAANTDSLITLSMYQQLYAAATLDILHRALVSPATCAAELLSGVDAASDDEGDVSAAAAPNPGNFLGAHVDGSDATGNEDAEPLLEEPILPHSDSRELHEDDDVRYEPLTLPMEQRPRRPPSFQGVETAGTPLTFSLSMEAEMLKKVAYVAKGLRYERCSADEAWAGGGGRLTTTVLLKAVSAGRSHPRFTELQPVVEALCRLCHDRAVDRPSELHALLPAMIEALKVPSTAAMASCSDAGTFLATTLAISLAASLVGHVTALPARRALWRCVDASMLPPAGLILERLHLSLGRNGAASATSSAKEANPELLGAATQACQLLYFWAMEGSEVRGSTSGAAADVEAAVIKAGAWQPLTMLVLRLGSDVAAGPPLRLASLLGAAAVPELAAWSGAVPGCLAAWDAAARASGAGGLHAALWASILGRTDADSALASLLRDRVGEGGAVGAEVSRHTMVFLLTARVLLVSYSQFLRYCMHKAALCSEYPFSCITYINYKLCIHI
jgi:hypothetical protein